MAVLLIISLLYVNVGFVKKWFLTCKWIFNAVADADADYTRECSLISKQK